MVDARAPSARPVLGRIEHVGSGRAANVTSRRKLANVLHTGVGATEAESTQRAKGGASNVSDFNHRIETFACP